jgi:4-aminobutyrate aminotransferase-like enzyme
MHAKGKPFSSAELKPFENAVKIARAATGRPMSFLLPEDCTVAPDDIWTHRKSPRYKGGFAPFRPGPVRRVPEDVGRARIARTMQSVHQLEATGIAAMIIEPIQGEAGFRVAPFAFCRHRASNVTAMRSC